MKVLITGGAGFIGSHLSERMLAEGHSVAVLDDLSTGSVDNLNRVLAHPRLQFVEGSVLDAGSVGRLVGRAELVVHLAAVVGVRRVLEDPLGTIQTNVAGTETVLKAAARTGVRVLVASTSEVYGKNASDTLCETADSVLGPSSVSRWSYATAKKVDEFLALAYAQSCRLPVILTRFFNVAGPRQAGRYGMVLPAFVRAALAGDPICVYGDGTQTRNFLYVGDCVEALLRLLADPASVGEVFNIGGAEEISILDLAQRVKRLTGSSSPIERIPYAEAYPEGGYEDMRRRVPCICKIRKLTGWSPVTSVDETILATARHWQNPAAWLRTPQPVLVARL